MNKIKIELLNDCWIFFLSLRDLLLGPYHFLFHKYSHAVGFFNGIFSFSPLHKEVFYSLKEEDTVSCL